MLNIFPIQWLAMFAYLLLRVWVAMLLIWLGYRHASAVKELIATTRWPLLPQRALPIQLLILFECLAGLVLMVGAYTQIVVGLIFMYSLKMIIWNHRFSHPTIPDRYFYFLLLGACLSLFITGAGAIAFDLPI